MNCTLTLRNSTQASCISDENLMEEKTDQGGPEGEYPNEKGVEGEIPGDGDKGGKFPNDFDEEKVQETVVTKPVVQGTSGGLLVA